MKPAKCAIATKALKREPQPTVRAGYNERACQKHNDLWKFDNLDKGTHHSLTITASNL